MAEFVSTTLPTYSDPLRAQTIKALEQRHKEMLAQSAAAGAITPENTQTPIQGFGHLANQLGDSFQRARVDQAAAAQRQMLAQTMAGIDWEKGPTSQQIAGLGADPDLMRQVLTTMAENRRAAAQNAVTTRGQDVTAGTATRGQDITERTAAAQRDLTREEGGATRDLTRSEGAAGRDLTRSESSLTRQQQLDMADKATLARREEAIAERDWKSAENRQAAAEATGQTELAAKLKLEAQDAQNRYETVKQNNQNTFQGGENAADRAQREALAKSEQTFKQGESQAERDARVALQGGQQAFQAGESAQERQLRERLQGSQQTHQTTENALNRTATATNQAAQIASHENIAAKAAAAKAAETAADPKRAGEVAALGEKYARQHQAVTKLGRAVEILDNGGINTGPWARAETVAANIANGRFGTDKDMAQRTTEFNSIVNEATIQQMSDTLKGQTTNFEMDKFLEVMNNPNTGPEARVAAIQRLYNAAKVGRDLSANAFTQSGGKLDIIHQHLGGGGAAGGASAGASGPLQEAQKAINEGAPFDAVVKRLQDAGLSASGLKQKGM